jgi:hypothetical protein
LSLPVEVVPGEGLVILQRQVPEDLAPFVVLLGVMVDQMGVVVLQEILAVVPEEQPLLMVLEVQEADCPAAAEQQVLVEEY